MAEKEIKIGFPETKMEALEFFLRENDTTVEKVLKEHLDKTYEKSVPQQVRKFVESKMTASAEDAGQSEDSSQRQTRGQGRRGTSQNTARESVQEQEDSGVQPEQEAVEQESWQEQDSGMVMSM